ncbi:S-adenosyl-L-methionine-dependent methyltransferase [Radiomyces spectabilis]|uniref:S-adenosyl-L-methionine-dependent methyltransferase n=1 Tax=Radiomyces spectabilis TaxID=64574 RepID=UPI00221F4043|nr:S-adenosyl-L-methionine-dependent methyltransferase [Radiomyces spectabilis]KAI8381353.1 S-adenosyl-L-methionine-dependent methyltransferase [Radiomyces spectabilis]
MPSSNKKERRGSWFMGWLSNWMQRSKTNSMRSSPSLSPREDLSKQGSMDTPRSSIAEPIDVPKNSSITFMPTVTLPHRPTVANSLSSERRNSQQTIGSSVLSDDQFSSSSCHRRDSNERNVLSELWSKARSRHPHYPRFHWPHYHHRRTNHIHSLSSSPRRSDEVVLVLPDNSLASSYQDHQHRRPPSLMAQHRHGKRHSITSLISGDNTPVSVGSRPASIFCSQPASPNFAALMKDGHLFDYQDDEDIDPYYLDEPTDRTDRWVVKHELVHLALDGLFCSPLDVTADKHVLHVGCGEGGWGIEMALRYPKWIIVGIDDYEGGPSPNRRIVPRNFKFIRCYDTLLEGLKSLPDHAFDLVHCRFLILSYSFEQYRQLVKECWRVTKPGGFVEIIEMDMRIYHGRPLVGSVAQTLNSEVIHVMESRSLDPRLARRLHDLFDISVKSNYTSLPLGVWGGRLGVMFRDDVHDLIDSFQTAVAELKQTETRDDQQLEAEFELMDEEMELQRAFMNLHHCFAQTPLNV